MVTPSFSTKQACSFFFKPMLDDQDEPTSFYRCQGLVVRKQKHKTGYSSYIRPQHSDYAAVMAASGTASGTLTAFVDKKNLSIFSWMDFVVDCGLPFAFPEHPTARKYTSLPFICTETLMKYMGLTTEAVEQDIISVLPPKFGIIFDGSTFHSEHYVAVFAAFGHDNRSETILLAVAPLVDDRVEDYIAAAHVTFLTSILAIYKRRTANVLYLVADNCSTNGRVRRYSTFHWLGAPATGLTWL